MRGFRLPKLLRPWSTVDDEELRLLRLMESRVRRAVETGDFTPAEFEELLDMLSDARRN